VFEEKKKFQENYLRQAEGNLQNIEDMINTIEFSKIQQQIIEGLKQGNAALKELQKMSVEEVEDLMLDTKEAIDQQQEIDRLLSEQLTPEDDFEILKELNELTATEESPEEPLLLPDVPDYPLPVRESLEKDDVTMEDVEPTTKTKSDTKQSVLA